MHGLLAACVCLSLPHTNALPISCSEKNAGSPQNICLCAGVEARWSTAHVGTSWFLSIEWGSLNSGRTKNASWIPWVSEELSCWSRLYFSFVSMKCALFHDHGRLPFCSWSIVASGVMVHIVQQLPSIPCQGFYTNSASDPLFPFTNFYPTFFLWVSRLRLRIGLLDNALKCKKIAIQAGCCWMLCGARIVIVVGVNSGHWWAYCASVDLLVFKLRFRGLPVVFLMPTWCLRLVPRSLHALYLPYNASLCALVTWSSPVGYAHDAPAFGGCRVWGPVSWWLCLSLFLSLCLPFHVCDLPTSHPWNCRAFERWVAWMRFCCSLWCMPCLGSRFLSFSISLFFVSTFV